MHEPVRNDVVSSYPFAAAMVRAPAIPALSLGQDASYRIGLRLRQSCRQVLRRIVRGIRLCVTSARASTTSSLRHEADARQADTQVKPHPLGAFLRRIE